MRTAGWSCRVAVAGATALLTIGASVQAQAAAPNDPWAKVPAVTTTCYQSQGRDQTRDAFYAQLDAARAAIAADKERQEAINQQIETQFRSLSPMEQATRMQKWMMSNPQEAMKYMEAIQASASAATGATANEPQEQKARDAAWQALTRKYDDARRQAHAPAEARIKTLQGSAYRPGAVVTNVGFDDPGDSAAVVAEKHAIRRMVDSSYESVCPQWWGPSGQFQTYLKSERTRMQQQQVAYLESFDAPLAQQYMIMNTPAASYRSTASHKVAIEYLDLMQKVYDLRNISQQCNRAEYCK